MSGYDGALGILEVSTTIVLQLYLQWSLMDG